MNWGGLDEGKGMIQSDGLGIKFKFKLEMDFL